MKAYVIKSTYLEGKHEGRSHILIKGGYVSDEKTKHHIDDCYGTLAQAKAVCTKYKKNNEIERNIERKTKRTSDYIYNLESFEPIEVEAFGTKSI